MHSPSIYRRNLKVFSCSFLFHLSQFEITLSNWYCLFSVENEGCTPQHKPKTQFVFIHLGIQLIKWVWNRQWNDQENTFSFSTFALIETFFLIKFCRRRILQLELQRILHKITFKQLYIFPEFFFCWDWWLNSILNSNNQFNAIQMEKFTCKTKQKKRREWEINHASVYLSFVFLFFHHLYFSRNFPLNAFCMQWLSNSMDKGERERKSSKKYIQKCQYWWKLLLFTILFVYFVFLFVHVYKENPWRKLNAIGKVRKRGNMETPTKAHRQKCMQRK